MLDRPGSSDEILPFSNRSALYSTFNIDGSHYAISILNAKQAEKEEQRMKINHITLGWMKFLLY